MYKILHIPTSTFLYTRERYLNDLEENFIIRIVWAYEEIPNLSFSSQSEMVIVSLSTKSKCQYILDNLHHFNFCDNELYQNLLNYEIIKY